MVYTAGGPEVLQLCNIDDPAPRQGWVLMRVRAFGVNRSEVITRGSPGGHGVTFPRVLGLECAGEVIDTGGDPELAPGQKAIAVMGGMGKEFDGGYAELALVPSSNVIPVETALSWVELASIPMAFGTAWGSVINTLGIHVGQSILIRGASSSVGTAAVVIAKTFGAQVVATTRSKDKADTLQQLGADIVLIDDGAIAEFTRQHFPDGVTVALELVGPSTAQDTAAATSPGGILCISGFLGGSWDVEGVAALSPSVRVTRFKSGVMSRATYGSTFQRIAEGVESGDLTPSIDRTFRFEEVPLAHEVMESNQACGKLVVALD